MAKTAVVNPRRRRKSSKRRRRNPSTSNPRRRRRTYGSARRRRTNTRRRTSGRRRRNPTVQQVYSSGGYRTKNPDLFDIDHMLHIMPAATGGIWAVRWAMRMAGPFEAETVTTPSGQQAQIAVPGIKHAFAGVIAAKMGSGIIGQMLGDASKAQFAEIAALGFVGDLFMRTRVMSGSQWVADNLMLQGVDDCDQYDDETGDDYDPSMGADPQYVVGPDGYLYQMSGIATDPARLNGLQDQSRLGGLQDQSRLGMVRRGPSVNGFGYS